LGLSQKHRGLGGENITLSRDHDWFLVGAKVDLETLAGSQAVDGGVFDQPLATTVANGRELASLYVRSNEVDRDPERSRRLNYWNHLAISHTPILELINSLTKNPHESIVRR
jgi:carbohydrate-selective porin OprB